MIALGVLVAVVVAQRRWRSWGGDEDDIVTVAVWAVPAGLIGARLYHVITDWNRLYDDGRWTDAFLIWRGGLGIPGGVLVGAIVGVVVARRTVPSWRRLADAAAPALPIAQAIGRLGNYFNQELYGRATDLPWGLQVDPGFRPTDSAYSTYHPTFLYEGLWNLALAGLIIWGGTKVVFKPGRWFAVYIAGYGLGRLWVESLRIDTASLILGVRVNIWMSLTIILVGLIWLLWGGGPVNSEATARLRAGVSPAEVFGAETAFIATEERGDSTVAGDSPATRGSDHTEVSEGGDGADSDGTPDSDEASDADAGSGEDDAEHRAAPDSGQRSDGESDAVGESGPRDD